MLRNLLLIIVLVILIAIGLVSLGVINLKQDANGVTVETKDFEVGTTTTNVQVPVVRMENRTVELPKVQVEADSQANGQ
jgi:hypothetical protein